MDLPVPAGTVLSEHYRVDRVLGAGSMGVVAMGWHLELDQPVAIKFPNPGVFPTAEAVARFRREVRAAARIRSKHVVRVIDVGLLEGGLPYLVMELLEGRNLEEELAARGMLPVEEAVRYLLEAIEVLAEAHAASIVHRDLKPANLFLARQPDDSRLVKVLDFGVAKSIAEGANAGELRLTRTGVIVGSPLYMAPEQLRSNTALDCRVDIWALGAILFQLVTAHTPYEATSVAELYAKLLRDPPTHPAHYRSDLPPGFAAVLLRCLATEPSSRYPDVSALADALLPFAPPSSRVNAQRARGVLFGDSDNALASSFPTEDRAYALTESELTAGSWGTSASGRPGALPRTRRALTALTSALFVVVALVAGRALAPRLFGRALADQSKVTAPKPGAVAARGPLAPPPVTVVPLAPLAPSASPKALIPSTSASAPTPAAPHSPARAPRRVPPHDELADFGGRK